MELTQNNFSHIIDMNTFSAELKIKKKFPSFVLCPYEIDSITHRQVILFIFIVTPCMLSSYSIITPTTAHI